MTRHGNEAGDKTQRRRKISMTRNVFRAGRHVGTWQSFNPFINVHFITYFMMFFLVFIVGFWRQAQLNVAMAENVATFRFNLLDKFPSQGKSRFALFDWKEEISAPNLLLFIYEMFLKHFYHFQCYRSNWISGQMVSTLFDFSFFCLFIVMNTRKIEIIDITRLKSQTRNPI